MITVSVLYPNKEGAKFDMSYYLSQHIPMVKKVLGPALKGVTVEQGVGGAAPGSKAAYSTVCHLRFDSIQSFQGSFGPNAERIQKDVPNYSSVEPIVQISEVKLS